MSSRVPVTFSPAGVTVWVESGSTIIDAARAAGVMIAAPCGGRGVCGKCAVKVVEGTVLPPDDGELRGLAIAPPGIRLACRARVDSPVTIRPVVGAAVRAASDAGMVDDDRFVAAVDLGTTTVGSVIIGSVTGRELGRAWTVNKGITFGSDVITRISAAQAGSAIALRDAASLSILEALEAACGSAGACLNRIERLVIAGNPAMIALLTGAELSGLSQAPFSVPERIGGEVSVPDLASRIAEGGVIVAAPPLAPMVGGDITAGLLATGMLDTGEDGVFVDIGTNAEIAVRRSGRLWVSSAAAGPAFEGYSISSGGSAGPGALLGVRVENQRLATRVEGGGPATHLSGSGLVSLVAELRRLGHLTADGLMEQAGPLEPLFDRDEAGVLRMSLTTAGEPPFLTQLDVRAFQTAKAAVAAGLLMVSRAAGLKRSRPGRVVITGSFGGALPATDLLELGVIPGEFADTLETFTDAALMGAGTIAFHVSAAGEVERVAAGARHVQLAEEPGFSREFIAATALEPFTLKRGFRHHR